MEVYVVAGRRANSRPWPSFPGETSRHPLAAAMALVRDTLADTDAVANSAAWREFWSTSGIELADAELQNWWYRIYTSTVRSLGANGNAVGLAANFTGLAGGQFAQAELQHPADMTEQVCINRLVTELLLQSVAANRIFPAWPASSDARFRKLLAAGGFEVSAEQTGGRIARVKLHSSIGGLAENSSARGKADSG